MNRYQCMGLKLTLSKISGPFKCLFMLYPAEDMLKKSILCPSYKAEQMFITGGKAHLTANRNMIVI